MSILQEATDQGIGIWIMSFLKTGNLVGKCGNFMYPLQPVRRVIAFKRSRHEIVKRAKERPSRRPFMSSLIGKPMEETWAHFIQGKQ